jgi:hypothetical protein
MVTMRRPFATSTYTCANENAPYVDVALGRSLHCIALHIVTILSLYQAMNSSSIRLHKSKTSGWLAVIDVASPYPARQPPGHPPAECFPTTTINFSLPHR